MSGELPRGRRSAAAAAADPPIRRSGRTFSRAGFERRRAYLRARERARSAIARRHHDEYQSIATPLIAGAKPHSREYATAQAAAKRAIAARYPAEFRRLVDEQLVAELGAQR